ncbi:MAG: hypothetical protein ABSA58_25940 [Acetobacteraceae bacterium]|jgi:hypothetical protein
MLTETANWVIYGARGKVLGFAASPRRALDRALEYARSGAVVLAVAQLASDNVVVFPAQMDRLRKVIAGREVPPIRHTDTFADTIDDLRDA